MEFVNLTNKKLSLRRGDGGVIDLPAAKCPARVTYSYVPDDPLDGVPVKRKRAVISGLPGPEVNVIYIAGVEVWEHAQRPDVFGLTDLDHDTPWNEGWDGVIVNALVSRGY